MGKNNERLAPLDSLRAVFGIGIVIFHTGELFGFAFSKALRPIYNYGGYYGNYMFFVVSGFVIALHYKERIVKGNWGFRRFMSRRLLRIYPIYFLSNIARILLGGVPLTFTRTFETLFMISTGWFGDGDSPYNLHAWFICVLMLCYIIYFVIGKISSRFNGAYPILCGFLIMWGAALEIMDWNFPFQYRVSGEGYMNFFLGVMLAELYGSFWAQGTGISQNKRKMARAVCYASLAVSLLLIFVFGLDALPGNMRWWITLVCGELVLAALSGGIFSKICCLPLLQMLGKCSLSLTLLHGPLALFFKSIVDDWGLDVNMGYILYLILAVAAAILSYYCLEKEFYPETQEVDVLKNI